MFIHTLTRCRQRSMRYAGIILTGFSLLLSSVSANAAAPSAPGSLRYENYSKTSGEVFWNRATDDGLVVAYEIKVNNTIIGKRDVLSYYMNPLVNGQSYTVVVTSIDNQGNRSTPASVSFVAGGATTTTPPATGGLAAPTGLKASVYSATSAEIMWTRPTTFGLSYEVSRNGTVMATTTGISYYDNTLTAGTAYTYKVVAINRSGNRSPAASVSVNTSTGSTGGGGTVTPPTSTLAAPTGLKASVYSATSAEIMWTRPTTVGLSYEVSRNGSVVTTTTGISYYDKSLTPATSYTYKVVAIDRNTNRSSPSSVMLNTPSRSGGTNGTSGTSGTGSTGSTGGGDSIISNVSPSIVEPANVYTRDGYGLADVIRVDVRTVTTPGVCTADDLSGCTLADVMADIDKTDALTVDIPIHVSAADFPDDGSVSNAELRMRGSGSRNGAQKSLRIKLDSKDNLWRGERYFQLNKHPFDGSRLRNKLATDVMSVIPSLPSLRTQFVNLWIDDGNGPVDYGLFTHVERVNDNYLENRGWDDNGNVYKTEDFRFNKSDLSDTLVDADGKPLDKDRFETSLSIENGKDHRALQAMLQDMNNPARTFKSVLDQYFDRSNVLAWVATNILVHQADAVRHNFILYNPTGTRKFYFIPWDYDEAMGVWNEPPRDLSNDSLRQRSEYGYGLAAGNVLLEGFYRLPGIHDEILKTVDYLRENVVTDQFMTEKVDTYFALVAPFQERLPDSAHNPYFNLGSAPSYVNAPGKNAESLRNTFRAPIGPILQAPQKQASNWLFSWRPAYDVTGTSGGITYRLQVASTPTFNTGTIVADVSGIPDGTGTLTKSVDSARLPKGNYYARLIATPANEPQRFFQVSGNKLYFNNKAYYGAIRFSVD